MFKAKMLVADVAEGRERAAKESETKALDKERQIQAKVSSFIERALASFGSYHCTR